MKLAEYLDERLVLADMKAAGKAEALDLLTAPLGRVFPDMDLDLARRVLMEREQLGTTGIGDGVAIPHGKLSGLERIVVVAGRSLAGVDFEALDFKPCRIFFLVLAPEQVAGLHLRILAHISRLLKDQDFRKEFMGAGGQQALWGLLQGV